MRSWTVTASKSLKHFSNFKLIKHVINFSVFLILFLHTANKSFLKFHLWFLRRMMTIPWTARVSNERILEMAGVRRALLGEVRSRQHTCLGHIIRENVLAKLVLAGRVEGRRARGMQRMKYMDSLVADAAD